MKRIVVFALVLNAALLGVIAKQLVAIAGGGAVATQNGDTNGDGSRDIGDAIYLLQWLFGGGEEPVAFARGGGGLTPEQVEIFEHMSIVQLPVDDDGNIAKTIRFSGVNVQVVNGTGSTAGDVNGLGNLVVGYQELKASANDRSGSHNLVVGSENNYSTYAGQVVGSCNTISGLYSTVSGGLHNTASEEYSTVSGGLHNTASGEYSTVSGGAGNTASGYNSTVGGGAGNRALGETATISGGGENQVDGFASTVSGGINNGAASVGSTVSGGDRNYARGRHSTVSGGENNDAFGEYSTVSGGSENSSSGQGQHIP